MILKKLKRTNLQKTKATMIGGLVDYILAQKDEQGLGKRMYAFGLNFVARTTRAWKQEMIALSEGSIHSKMPVSHWVMSWKENEFPTREQVGDAVTLFLDRMGLSEHQAIVAAHVNTSNFHVHIAVNRVHPLTEKVVQPHKGFDIEAAHRIVAEIEHKQGWASSKNARYRVNEQGQIVRNQRPRVVKPKPEAQDFENATGEKSAQRMAQEKAHPLIQKATCWQELHTGLATVGMRYVRKGSGAVIYVGETPIKASSVDRDLSLGKLCKRLGEFEESLCVPVVPPPEPEPVSHVCEQEWQEYQAQRRQLAEERSLAQEHRKEAERREHEEQRQERQQVLAKVALHGLPMLNIARYFLKLQQQSQRAESRKQRAKARCSLPRFKTWLGHKSQRLAQLWRLRERITPDMQVRKYSVVPLCKLKRPFACFQDMLRKKYADVRMDQSRLDAGTVLYLRCMGYTQEEVDRELARHSPRSTSEVEKRDILERRSRILQYAYGPAGDIVIAAIRPTDQKLRKILTDVEEQRQKQREPYEQRLRPYLRPGSPATAYFAHLDNISRSMAIDDLRQVDAMIALRMRANGHSRKVVTDTIDLCAPVIREYPGNSNWQGYAERTAEYAFGKVGDQDMARNQRVLPLWRKIEGLEEKQKEEESPMWRMR